MNVCVWLGFGLMLVNMFVVIRFIWFSGSRLLSVMVCFIGIVVML